jgi:hypothetical protein
VKKLVKKCIYCKCEVADKSVIDFCERCGKGVFGDRMFEAIVSNMEEAQDRGDLDQGSLRSLS